MRFGELARYFARLEATSGRHTAVDITAELLARAATSEREPIAYLLQGRLRPPYEGVEVGVGERILGRVLARAYTVTETRVERLFRRLGDLGLVAEALSPSRPAANRALTVRGAHDALLEVAQVTGAGAVERRICLLAELLHRATALEAKYLVRAVQGRLRLGIGDATILEATALGALRDRGKRDVVERAYNIRSDLGGVVRVAYTRGERALARMTPGVGVPVRPALAQRLASAAAIVDRLGAVQAEPKYDGFRLQLHKDGERMWAFSRRLENVSAMFPELTDGARRQLRARRAIIEGEAVVTDPRTGRFLPFQVTMTRKRRHRIAEAVERHPLRLYAFDLLYADGRDYLPRPQHERHERLSRLLRVRAGDPVVVTEVLSTDRPDELQAYFDAMIKRGLEGIVAKRPDAPYRAGARGYDWVKLKRAYQSALRDTVDLVLVGYLAGKGHRAVFGIGSLLGAVYDPTHDRFRTVAKIGSGPSERQWRTLREQLDRWAVPSRPRRVDSTIVPDVWAEPKIVVEVLADEITRSPLHTCGKRGSGPGYALRFPRMLDGVRTDRAPEDATSEREVLDLFRMQRAAVRRPPA